MSEPDIAHGLQASPLSLRTGRRSVSHTQKAAWFSDLEFTWGAVIVRKTGRRIGLKDVTPTELARFLAYFGPVLIESALARLSPRRKLCVFFTPDRPRPWYVVWSACALAGIRIARNEADADAVMAFEDVTLASPSPLNRPVINGGCTDIRKSRVTEGFDRVAPYALAIDPSRHFGQAVEKSEENGVHDGRIIQCPAAPQPNKVYQRFIDSSDGETAFDYRTTIIGRRPRFVLVKTKPATDRFSIHNTTVVYRDIDEVFTVAEIELLTRFAEEMALDWAAIDVLRDRTDGRIFVVDVNRTDTGPAVDLSMADRAKLKRQIAAGFRELVEANAKPARSTDAA